MSPAVEAQHLIRTIAGPMPAGSGAQIQAMLDLVARETRLGFRRLKGLWHGEARAIRSDEMDALRAAAARKTEAREAIDRELYQDLKCQMAAMEDRVAALASQLALATAAATRVPPDAAAAGARGRGEPPRRGSAPDRSLAGAR